MNIMELGALGEFLGSVGVIASLVYVAIQIRTNTRAVDRQATQNILAGRADTARFFGADEASTELYWRGAADPDSLSEVEWQRFFMFATVAVRPFELAYLDHANGHLADDLWQGQRFTLEHWMKQPGWLRCFAEFGESLHPSFRAYVESLTAH